MVRNHQDGYPFINLSLFFVVENIHKRHFFWKNWLVIELRTAMGGGLLGISKQNISIFKTLQKMVTKFEQFKKLKKAMRYLKKIISIFKTWPKKLYQILDNLKSWNVEKGPNFVNCLNFVTFFCRFLKMKIFFFISLGIPHPSQSGIHWPIKFSKKNYDSVYFHFKNSTKNGTKVATIF